MTPLTIFCHFHNEEFLLPYWLRHHQRLFDHGVLVDRASTDRSAEIVRELAPTWEVVQSRNPVFDARDCDLEMMELERQHEGWKMVLNATEFLFHDDLRGHLAEREGVDRDSAASVLRVRCITMVDRVEERGAPVTGEDLFFQRFHGYFGETAFPDYSRWLHREADGDYGFGRHATEHPSTLDPNLLVLKFSWSPYEYVKARKLQIQRAIPESDIRAGMSWQHLVTPEELDLQYLEHAARAEDLRTTEPYASTLERLRRRFGADGAGHVPPPPPSEHERPPGFDDVVPVSAAAYRELYRRAWQSAWDYETLREVLAAYEALYTAYNALERYYREDARSKPTKPI
jgi:glycosyl transferase family 2